MPAGPRVNLTSVNEYVPEIEQRIRIVKERSCAFCHSLPFNQIPKLMTIHTILNIVKMLNLFLTKQAISLELRPLSIITGESLEYNKHFIIHPRQYCQVHDNEEPRKSDKVRTKGTFYLGPCSNLQGRIIFMNLQTGQNISRYNQD